jgi:hypothetical protein
MADVNFYAYVGNNPVRFRDPEGLLGFPGGNWPASTTSLCAVQAEQEGRRLGRAIGFRYGHCMAACLARRCGLPQLAVKGLGLGNEVKQTWDCLWNGENCHSAFAPVDFRDNELGFTCPAQRRCEDQCAPLLVTPSKAPGQFGPFFKGE